MRAYAWMALSFWALSVSAEQLTPVWVEAGENGAVMARVIVNAVADCPSIAIDGASRLMLPRLPVPRGFVPVCEAQIPARARSASVDGHALALPKADPSKMVVFGDTGCRIKGAEIQDCNDAGTWPLPSVAAHAAAAKPGLMIHVGDYLYREDMCPPDKQSFCGGTPSGDNWPTWNADFFTPAAKLLQSVPWVFARGNHESCGRSWRGWFYYLDPHPWRESACEAIQAPYLVTLGSFQLVVFDSSAVGNNMPAEQVDRYANALASIHASHAWLVVHHPFWGFTTTESGVRPVSLGLQAAWLKARPAGIDLVVSGHVHLFELLSFDGGLPPALVVGDGGTNLAMPAHTKLNGIQLASAKILAATSEHDFGYTIVDRTADGWKVTLRSIHDRPLAECSVHGRDTSCQDSHAGTR